MACRAWEVCLHSMTKKTGGEKTHRRLLIRYAELILEILTIGKGYFTWTYGILPAICPAGRYVRDSALIRNVIQREPYVPGFIPNAHY